MSAAAFERVVAHGVAAGLAAAAILDRDGRLIARAGALDEDEVRPIAGVVTRSLEGEDLARRMFAGELVGITLGDRTVRIGIAARCAFVVAILPWAGDATEELARTLRRDVERVIRGMQTELAGVPPWGGGGSGGPPSGPAELSLVELGLTVNPKRGKA